MKKKIFIAAAAVCSLLAMLTGCSVTVQDSSETSGGTATIGLKSSQGSGIFCGVCGNEIEMKDADDTYGITFSRRVVSAVWVEKSYHKVCPNCAENIVEYIEGLRR